MRCGRTRLQYRRSTRGLFSRRDLAVVDRRFKRRALAQQTGVECVCRARIADDGNVILKLNSVGISEFEDRRVLYFDLDDRDVFALVAAFAGWRAVRLDLKGKGSAVRNDYVMDLLKTLEVAVLIELLNNVGVKASRVSAELLGYLLDHLPEQRLLCFFFAVFGD